jgi:isoleucyl-tRNA synthetase
VRFVPGWDCHGLPIELKGEREGGGREEGGGDVDVAIHSSLLSCCAV